MLIVRNFFIFCSILTVISCSGLSKTTKKEIAPENKLVKLTTLKGVMILDLYDETPKHKANFLKLVENNFYDSLLFHRVINSFMVQGGDPKSKGAKPGVQLGNGGPGYTVPAEFNAKLIHKKGALCAARLGDKANPKKASSGSQFYIVQGKKTSNAQLNNIENGIKRTNPDFAYTEEQKKIYNEIGGTPFLDQNYTVFGEVIYGLDVIDKIASVETVLGDRPNEDVIMQMEIVDKTTTPELNPKK